MTRMLASVSSAVEAAVALAGGADIIELKPNMPGAVTLGAVGASVDAIRRRCLVSVGLGEPPMQPGPIVAAVREIGAMGVGQVNLRLHPGGDVAACINALAEASAHVKLVAVFLADMAPDLSLLPLLKRCGFTGAMLDIHDKATGTLIDHFDLSRLRGFIDNCRAAGLTTGFAGSLEMPDIPRLLVLRPDVLGFHGTLCNSGGTIELARVQAVRRLIPAENQAPNADDRPLPMARLMADDVPVDLVFVKDFMLPVFIGTYARERDAPQNVRFAVTASVMRADCIVEGMRDVFSYDLITDGIRMLVGSGHVPLVETLAERIAAIVLNHPRVTKVMVRVEKLETGSGTVGVEIERTRLPC